MIETYLFDMNDTIIDSSIYRRMFSELAKTLIEKTGTTEEKLKSMMPGKNLNDSYDLCKKLNSTEIYYAMLEKYTRHTFILKTKDIPKIFRKIKEKHKRLGIVSNSQQRTVEIFLNRFNLSEYIDFIELGSKDTVLFWITLARRHGLEPDKTMLIDDSDDVLDVAQHAGYKVLNVRNIDELEGLDY